MKRLGISNILDVKPLSTQVMNMSAAMYSGSEGQGCLTSSSGCPFLNPSNSFPIHQRPQKGRRPGGGKCFKNYSQKTMKIRNLRNNFRILQICKKIAKIYYLHYILYTIFPPKFRKNMGKLSLMLQGAGDRAIGGARCFARRKPLLESAFFWGGGPGGGSPPGCHRNF